MADQSIKFKDESPDRGAISKDIAGNGSLFTVKA
jgi:hypothetical protein